MAANILDNKFLEELSKNIQHDDISIRKLAKKAGCDHSTVAKVMKGEMSLSFPILAKLCQAMHWSVFDYIEDGGEVAIILSHLPPEKQEKIRQIIANGSLE